VLGGLWHLELLPTLCGVLGRGEVGGCSACWRDRSLMLLEDCRGEMSVAVFGWGKKRGREELGF